jgi:hypothetical protein
VDDDGGFSYLRPVQRILGLLPLLALLACAGESAPPDLSMRVHWLTGEPAADLPDEVAVIRIILIRESAPPIDTNVSVGNFMTTEGGRPYVAHSLLSNLPTGEELLIRVEGQRTDTTLAYVGHVGPLVLAAGQRYYADLRMYQLDESVLTLGDAPQVALHAAAPLPDGRVLVAGGFSIVDETAECPPGAGLPGSAICYGLEATNEAWAFDPTSSRFHAIAGGMLEARGGASATTLPGGRVLVAGGAPRATLALLPQGGAGTFAPWIVPQLEDGSIGALATFEVFLPNANREVEDEDGDGDPGRGQFVGAASAPAQPGALNQPRFLHAAAHLEFSDPPTRVLLVGGMGGTESATTYELYDDDKPGGYGVYDATGAALGAARMAPAAVQLMDGRVWIFGGGVAASNADLAEVWSPSPTDPNGTIEPATASTDFASDGDHPEWSLFRPDAIAIAGGSYALVVGWLGPTCAGGATSPSFGGSEVCGANNLRSFTVNAQTGEALVTMTTGPHAFGGATRLDEGNVAVAGGLANLTLTRQASVEVFTGETMDGVATLSGSGASMRIQRAFHTTTKLPHLGMLSVGGFNVASDGRMLGVLPSAEALYLRRPPTVL